MHTGNEEVLEDEIVVHCSAAVDLEARRGAGAHVGLEELEERHERRVVQQNVAEAQAARRALAPAQPAISQFPQKPPGLRPVLILVQYQC